MWGVRTEDDEDVRVFACACASVCDLVHVRFCQQEQK